MRKSAGDLLTIENLPNQQAIAIMANVSRETVSRAIRSLIDGQVIERDYRRLIVRNAALLTKLARGEAELQLRAKAISERTGAEQPPLHGSAEAVVDSSNRLEKFRRPTDAFEAD
jgi:DNA-binding GntR family transcriptional regulator